MTLPRESVSKSFFLGRKFGSLFFLFYNSNFYFSVNKLSAWEFETLILSLDLFNLLLFYSGYY